LSRLQVLKKLESTLENFFEQVVMTKKTSVEICNSINTLDNIAGESLKGRYINNQLTNWFSQNRCFLESDNNNESEITKVANLLSSIKSGLDNSDFKSQKLIKEIEHWRDKGVIPKRKLILKLKPKSGEKNLLKEFMDLVSRENRYINSGEFDNMHLLSALDDILRSAEFKEDRMFIHLAGSIIYYLKANGYKVSPFAKRLKEIEQKKSRKTDVE
jgi:hypothetical protein